MYSVEAVEKDKSFGSITKQIASLEHEVHMLMVVDAETETQAIGIGNKIKNLINDMEKQRKGFVAGANDFVSKVNGLFRPFKARLDATDAELRLGMRTYRNKIEEEQKAALRLAEQKRQKEEEKYQEKLANAKAPERVKAPAPYIPPADMAKTTKTDSGSVTYRTVPKWKLVDISKVPMEYLVLDEVKVNKVVRAGLKEIPGFEIYEEKEPVFKN